MGAECSKCGYDIYDECGHCKVVDERDRLREALEGIRDELSNGPTANFEYIDQQFTSALSRKHS